MVLCWYGQRDAHYLEITVHVIILNVPSVNNLAYHRNQACYIDKAAELPLLLVALAPVVYFDIQ